MDPKEKEALVDFYKQNYEFYGDSIQALAWYNRETQEKRFSILTSFWDIRNSSILDVGAGLGDFWLYLKDNNIDVKYTGIDIFPDFVQKAKYKYPGEASFMYMELDEVADSYDYVFASGTFNHKCQNNDRYIRGEIDKMFNIALKGIAFNLLSEYTPYEMKDNKIFYYYNPEKIFEYCKKLTQNVTLKHDYLPNDFTIALSKV